MAGATCSLYLHLEKNVKKKKSKKIKIKSTKKKLDETDLSYDGDDASYLRGYFLRY